MTHTIGKGRSLTDEIARGLHGPDALADLHPSCDNPLHDQLVELMSAHHAVTSRALATATGVAIADVIEALQHLIRVGRVAVLGNGYVSAL